jgi:uncharacterized protein YbaP (TraB family)
MGVLMRRSLARLLLATGLLAATAAAADSGVWVIQGAANRVYIAGSIHLLRPEDSALPPALERAYADAERLVFELDLDDLDQAQVASEMMQAGTRTDGKSLTQTLPGPLAKRLAHAASELGLPVALLDTMEPWLASLMLTSVSLLKAGFSPEAGIDQQLATRAKSDHKPITGLETAAEQFAVFDHLSAENQVHLLDLTLDEATRVPTELAAIEQAWRQGDQARLAHELQDEMASFPELESALLIERNRKWLPAIRALLRGNDDVLVVVGAAHLLGDKGIIALLRADGQKLRSVAAL